MKRANFQACVWRNCLEPSIELPDIEDHGWIMCEGVVEPLWCEGPIIPEDLLDALDEVNDSEESMEFSEDEADTDESSDSQCDMY